jgi:hypothetical protein
LGHGLSQNLLAVANIQPDGDLCAMRKAEEEAAGAFVEDVLKKTRMFAVIWQPKLFREQIRFGGPYKYFRYMNLRIKIVALALPPRSKG